MAGNRRRIKPWHGAAGLIIVLFIIFANLVGTNHLPSVFRKPAETVNKATGGLLYSQSSAPLKDLSVHFIDVGQGDSIFIYCDGATMLIDSGPGSANGKAEKYVASLGVKNLDYVVATHPHEDHIGGFPEVISGLTVRKLIMTKATTNTSIFEEFLSDIRKAKIPVEKAVPGTSYPLGGGRFTILAPNADYTDLNDTSVVLRMCYKNRSFLFTGDASKDSESDMLSKGYKLQSDVLKVGHHGSATATTDSFLKAVSPEYAVISAGAGNSFGLPAASTVKKLKAAGIKTFRTDDNGTVVIASDGNTITCRTEK